MFNKDGTFKTELLREMISVSHEFYLNDVDKLREKLPKLYYYLKGEYEL